MNKSYYEPLIEYKEDLSVDDLKRVALQLRRDVADLINNAGNRAGHVGGEYSIADVMAALYGKYLRLDPDNLLWEDRDIMILSKGHNSGVQYAGLTFRNIISRETLLNEMNKSTSILQEHSCPSIPGIEAPTGALGMGLSAGAGMAWAAKKDGRENHVYVVLGDGECTEGQVWEAALFGTGYNLDNLTAIVDFNKYVITGNIQDIIQVGSFAEKFKAFGWDVQEIDGHNMEEIVKSLDNTRDLNYAPGKPRAIIANTIKGYPISFMMEDPVTYHSAHFDDEVYKKVMEELA